MDVRNLLADIPGDLPDEFFENLLQAPAFRIERIVSRGHCSPPGFWYDSPEHVWVLLVHGAARLAFQDRPAVDLRPGDHLNIPAGLKHRVEWTVRGHDTVWLAIHYA
jgi:cupin 2 domain-containing protein